MTCLSTNGKPGAQIAWFRNDEAIEEGMVYSVEDVEGGKLQNAVSVLVIQPRKEDNGALYQCQALNGALKDPQETMIVLSVMREYVFSSFNLTRALNLFFP